MHRWLMLPLLALALAGSPAAAAEDARCLLSFDSARLDVCADEVEAAAPALSALADPAAFADTRLRVIKFGQPLGAPQRGAVEALGVEILGYVPHSAYLVRVPGDDPDPAALDRRARALDGVVWAGPFLPLWKVEGNLLRQLDGARIVEQAGLEHLEITLQPGVGADAGRGVLAVVPGVRHAFTESGGDHQRLVVTFEPELLGTAVEQLAIDDNVAAIGLRWPVRTMNSQAGWLHQSAEIDLTPIFDQGIFGCDQVVGVLDTGVHEPHCSFGDPDFGPPAFDSCGGGTACNSIIPDFDHRKVGAYYKWSGSPGALGDSHGHGTHVAASAVGNNPAGAVDCETLTTPGGVTDLDGTAPGARLIAQEAGPGLQYLNSLGGNIYHAAEVAYDNGARIHNNSWGSSCRDNGNNCISGCQVAYRQGTRDADAVVWDFPELALMVAAGNSGVGCGPGADVGAAGNAKNVFSIGSTVRGIDGDDVSSFSSRGPTIDRRTKPDLMAQGGGTTQPTAIHSAATGTACGVAVGSGTSMASPTAAGLVALVREYLDRGFYPLGEEIPSLSIPDPSGALLKAILISGAYEMNGAGTGASAPNQNQGWGRIHLDDALYFAGDARRLWFHDERAGLETGGLDEHFLDVAVDQPLTVTLVWHDYPALVNADPHIVNRLRLEVESPNGEVWTQKLSPGGGLGDPDPFRDVTESDYDDRNTVHRMRFDTPVEGTWAVRVRGIQVAEGGQQPYAVAATGALGEIADPDFALRAAPPEIDVCAGTAADYTVELQSILDFDDPVDLAVIDGLPPGATATFSTNPAVPAHPAASVGLTVDATGAAPSGLYILEIAGVADGPGFPETIHSVETRLRVSAAPPAAGALLSPPDQATGQSLQPAFAWDDFADTRSYRFQLAADPGFENVLEDVVVEGTGHALSIGLDSVTHYYWRVAGINPCGQGEFSPVSTFATEQLAGDCPLDSHSNALLTEDFDGGKLPAGWSTDGSSGAMTWSVSNANSYSGGFAAFAQSPGAISDQRLATPPIALPAGAGNLVLTFQNWQHLDAAPLIDGCFDGGALEISTDDGSTWDPVEAEHILARDPDGPISTTWGNPLAGEPAWCGDPRDFWERYAVDLAAWAGEEIRLRFRLGTDSRAGGEGWYLDAVRVHACGQFTVGGLVSGLEGSGLVLRNNGGDDLAVSGNGAFTFPTALADGADYAVTVAQQPGSPDQFCSVSNGDGQIAGADVTGVTVTCGSTEPAIDVQPDSLSVQLEVDEEHTRSLEIVNTGGDTLSWEVTEDSTDPDCQLPDWIAATPGAGSIEIGQAQSLQVTVDGSGVDDGDIGEANLCIASNDPARPLVVVPVARVVVVFADGFE